MAEILRADGLIAYPTDSGYALGCLSGRARELERIREIRGLDDRHHFTLVCHDVSQVSQFATLDNAAFRAIKACTPGPYTFILPATKDVPAPAAAPQEADRGGADPRRSRRPCAARRGGGAAGLEHPAPARATSSR